MDGQDCVWEAKRYKIGHTRLESHYVSVWERVPYLLAKYEKECRQYVVVFGLGKDRI